MNDAIKIMLKQYGSIKDQEDQNNALKEIIQHIALLGLQRAKFFDKAAFYGGTALRMLYGLDRFSEDMDFCLENMEPSFSFKPYLETVSSELSQFGFDAQVEEKRCGDDVAVNSAFVKQNTLKAMLLIGKKANRIHNNQLLKVKLEVDKNNPRGAKFCKKLISLPTPFMIRTLTEPSLFAGKLHAIIARSYINRVKGRDYYDLLFYAARKTKVNIQYLEAKLINSKHLSGKTKLTKDKLQTLLIDKFKDVDFNKAKEDVSPFIKAEQRKYIQDWDCDLFSALCDDLQIE